MEASLLLNVPPSGQPHHRVLWPQRSRVPRLGDPETFATARVAHRPAGTASPGARLTRRPSGLAADLLHQNLHFPMVAVGDLGAGDSEKCGSRANQGWGPGTAGPARHQKIVSSCSAGPALGFKEGMGGLEGIQDTVPSAQPSPADTPQVPEEGRGDGNMRVAERSTGCLKAH